MWTVPFLKMHDMTFSYCVQQGNSCHPGEKFVKSPGSTIIFSKALSLVASCCSVSVKICGVSVSRGKGKGKSSFFSFTFFRGKVLLFARLCPFAFLPRGEGGGAFWEMGVLSRHAWTKGEALDCVIFLCFLNNRGNGLISIFLRGTSTYKLTSGESAPPTMVMPRFWLVRGISTWDTSPSRTGRRVMPGNRNREKNVF